MQDDSRKSYLWQLAAGLQSAGGRVCNIDQPGDLINMAREHRKKDFQKAAKMAELRPLPNGRNCIAYNTNRHHVISITVLHVL